MPLCGLSNESALSTSASHGTQPVLAFFATITVIAGAPSSFPLPHSPRDHVLKEMIIRLLMQFCNDSGHN